MCMCYGTASTHLIGVWTGKRKSELLLIPSPSTSIPNRTTAAAACRLHLPDHPAQHQLHPGRRPHHQEGDRVPRQSVSVVGGARGQHGHLQALASRTGHGVPHQCAADPAWRGRNWASRTAACEQDQVCRWAHRSPQKVVTRATSEGFYRLWLFNVLNGLATWRASDLTKYLLSSGRPTLPPEPVEACWGLKYEILYKKNRLSLLISCDTSNSSWNPLKVPNPRVTFPDIRSRFSLGLSWCQLHSHSQSRAVHFDSWHKTWKCFCSSDTLASCCCCCCSIPSWTHIILSSALIHLLFLRWLIETALSLASSHRPKFASIWIL